VPPFGSPAKTDDDRHVRGASQDEVVGGSPERLGGAAPPWLPWLPRLPSLVEEQASRPIRLVGVAYPQIDRVPLGWPVAARRLHLDRVSIEDGRDPVTFAADALADSLADGSEAGRLIGGRIGYGGRETVVEDRLDQIVGHVVLSTAGERIYAEFGGCQHLLNDLPKRWPRRGTAATLDRGPDRLTR
jgi:hypothetical protein